MVFYIRLRIKRGGKEAKMARTARVKENAAFFAKRAANWRNVFDPSLRLVRGKDSKGK